jgi:hypothetical protein
VAAVLATSAVGVAAAQAPAAPPASAPVGIVAKSCSGGFVHGVINGAQKCLRRGEFCAHAADRQYRRYGYRCTRRDANGSYHLT